MAFRCGRRIGGTEAARSRAGVIGETSFDSGDALMVGWINLGRTEPV
jgi:hypothetical protein